MHAPLARALRPLQPEEHPVTEHMTTAHALILCIGALGFVAFIGLEVLVFGFKRRRK